VIEDRYAVSSTVVASQLEPKDWHSVIGDETIADALCDRLVHNAHRIKLSGESIQRVRGDLTKNSNLAKYELPSGATPG
jgi:DNA replication protein DnaC